MTPRSRRAYELHRATFFSTTWRRAKQFCGRSSLPRATLRKKVGRLRSATRIPRQSQRWRKRCRNSKLAACGLCLRQRWFTEASFLLFGGRLSSIENIGEESHHVLGDCAGRGEGGRLQANQLHDVWKLRIALDNKIGWVMAAGRRELGANSRVRGHQILGAKFRQHGPRHADKILDGRTIALIIIFVRDVM